jgi:hypothetical protein
MKVEKLRFETKSVLLMVCAVLLLFSGPSYAADQCEIIRITKDKAGGGSSIIISPQKITVPVGTCTVWINFVRKGELQVSFRENAKQCMLATDAATGFKEIQLETGESCYFSEKLSKGKTASLVWSTPGTYKYTLETPATTGDNTYPGTAQGQGIIEVTGE